MWQILRHNDTPLEFLCAPDSANYVCAARIDEQCVERAGAVFGAPIDLINRQRRPPTSLWESRLYGIFMQAVASLTPPLCGSDLELSRGEEVARRFAIRRVVRLGARTSIRPHSARHLQWIGFIWELLCCSLGCPGG